MNQPPTTLYDLLKESVLAQSLLALVCIAGTFTLLLANRTVPDNVWILDASVISFFFGAKTLFNQRQLTTENARLLAQVAQQNAQMLSVLSTNTAVLSPTPAPVPAPIGFAPNHPSPSTNNQ